MDIEINNCDFCKGLKQVERTYLRPTNEPKKKTNEMYNEGDYFIIIKTCSDCGTPKELKQLTE